MKKSFLVEKKVLIAALDNLNPVLFNTSTVDGATPRHGPDFLIGVGLSLIIGASKFIIEKSAPVI